MTVTDLDREWAMMTIDDATDDDIIEFKIDYEDWLMNQEEV